MVHKANNFENVWKIIKKTRNFFLHEQPNPECAIENYSLLSEELIKENINKVKKIDDFDQEDLYETFDNVTDETLHIAAKMFTYLNYCPPHMFNLIKDLINNDSPKNILLVELGTFVPIF